VLTNTFCHIQGIGLKTESRLWAEGIRSWDDVDGNGIHEGPVGKHHFLKRGIADSRLHLSERDPGFFADALPPNEHWRIFPEFRESTAYLDIETTGVGPYGASITTIAVYDGKTVYSYVKDRNLYEFAHDIRQYKVIVTYNGRCFDVPFIEQFLGIRMKQAHIDLRYILKSLGYTGGLKGCEKKLGIDRQELDGVDGYYAVLLWHDFEQNRNPAALETLMAYNVLDAVNLERLMVMAYNLKIGETPFGESHRLTVPSAPENPFTPDVRTVRRIRSLIRMHN